LHAGYEPPVASLADTPGNETAAVDARIPVAQIKRPLLVESEVQTDVPVGVVSLVAGEESRELASAPRVAQRRAEGRREDREPGQRLREGAVHGPHAPGRTEIVGRIKHRGAEGATLPDVTTRSSLQLEVAVVPQEAERIRPRIAVVDRAQVPVDRTRLELVAAVEVHLDVRVPEWVRELYIGAPEADVEVAAGCVYAALDRGIIESLGDAAEHIGRCAPAVAREGAGPRRPRRSNLAAAGQAVGERRTSKYRHCQQGGGPQTCTFDDGHCGFPTELVVVI